MRVALMLACLVPAGAVLSDSAQDEALEALNRRNIRYSPEEFAELVRNDDAENVRIFLQAGTDPNFGFADGSPALCVTAAKGHTETLRALLDGGALVNSKDKDGYTPLMLAVLLGREEAALALLEKGADPNVQNRFGTTALLFAVQERRIPLVEALLKAKADAALQADSGISALSVALETRQEASLKLFRKAGYGGRLDALKERFARELKAEKKADAEDERDRQLKLNQQLKAAGGNRTSK